MILLDTNILTLFFDPTARALKNIDKAPQRVKHFIERCEKQRKKIVIPTPILSELLVLFKPEKQEEYFRIINNSKNFIVADFDKRAAIELAIMQSKLLSNNQRKKMLKDAWQKVKLDCQVVAIAKVNQVEAIYTDDKGMKTFATTNKIEVKDSSAFELPPKEAQMNIFEDKEGNPKAKVESHKKGIHKKPSGKK